MARRGTRSSRQTMPRYSSARCSSAHLTAFKHSDKLWPDLERRAGWRSVDFHALSAASRRRAALKQPQRHPRESGPQVSSLAVVAGCLLTACLGTEICYLSATRIARPTVSTLRATVSISSLCKAPLRPRLQAKSPGRPSRRIQWMSSGKLKMARSHASATGCVDTETRACVITACHLK